VKKLEAQKLEHEGKNALKDPPTSSAKQQKPRKKDLVKYETLRRWRKSERIARGNSRLRGKEINDLPDQRRKNGTNHRHQ